MKKSIKTTLLLIITFCTLSCTQQQARMPISRSSGTFMKESVVRNKLLIAGEESKIDSIIKSNPKNKYFASKKGYWYCYNVKNETDTLRPKKGDIAYFDYEITDFSGSVIYSEVELRPQVYRVDKQNIIKGLRDGIKLMRKNEKVTFLFPSHIAYGYHGDNKRIPSNLPIICNVTLNDIKSESKVVSENSLKNE